ncbi:MAG: DUF2723 domain-containing protein [Kouleothrix sp.]|nr:DUF2723 domain-containing protein [Kouleothrix sp.]
MAHADDNLRDGAGLALTLGVLGAAYARTLAPGVTWANDGADSGDLVTAAATLGVAHPTGYPTYVLLARLFQAIPLGDLAFRTNLLSAAAALGAALLVFLIVRRLLDGSRWRATVAATVAAIALGLSPVFWSQAVIAEVYSLNALFVAAIVLFALQELERPGASAGRAGAAKGLLAGLALGNHVTVALPALLWLGAAGLRGGPDGPRARLARLLWPLAGIGAGLLVYLYLPLRARAHPPVNWGDPQGWDGLWWVVSGRLYRGLAFGVPAAFVGGRVEAWASLLARQFGLAGLIAGCAGLVYGAARARPFVWLTLGIAAATSAFAIGYDTADSYAYLIPLYLIFAIWVGLGVERLLALAGRWGAYGPAVVAVGLAGLLAWRGVGALPGADASQDRDAIVFAERALAAAPPGAIVLTTEDRDSFALSYYRYALGARPDVVVVIEPLLQFEWYRRNLRAVAPSLRVPEQPGATWQAALAEANGGAGRVCRSDPAAAAPLTCD